MKKKKILKTLRELLVFVLLILITYWLLFKDQDMMELLNIVRSANILYIILGIFLMFMFYFIESTNVRYLLKLFGQKISRPKALKFTFIGFFFSAITPAASGGQPMEIYYMTKEKISGPKATMALLVQLCGYQISTIVLGIVCAIINPTILHDELVWLFIMGVSINILGMILFIVCIFSRRITRKLVNIFIKLLKVFRVRKIDEKIEKINKALETYTESSVFIKSHKREFFKLVLRVLIQTSFYYSVPFCVYKAFGLSGYNLFHLFTMQAVLFSTVSGIPLPGAIGISEMVFLKIFVPAFSDKLIKGSMLLSRGITFYLYVIVGLITVIFNVFKTRNITEEEIEENQEKIKNEIEEIKD